MAVAVVAVTNVGKVVSSDDGKEVLGTAYRAMFRKINYESISTIDHRKKTSEGKCIDYTQPSIPQLKRMLRGKGESYSRTSEKGC
jgi:hypothetical protein